MSIWGSWFISCLLFNITYCFIFINLIKENKIRNAKSTFFCILVAIIDGYTIYFNIGIRTLMMLMSMILLFKFIFKKSWSLTIIITFLIHILFAISEMLIAVCNVWIFGNDLSFFTTNFIGIIIINVEILTLCIFLFKSAFVKKTMELIINWYGDKNKWNLVITVIIAVATILFLLYKNVQGFSNTLDFLVNNIFVIGIVYFIICFLLEKTMNNRIKNEYNSLMNYAKTYEVEIIEKSKWQHEYENQLVIIKDKIDPENKKVIAYIDKLLKNKPSGDNSQWLIKLSKFPDIGIKGLLHYKICQMIQNNIHVYVDVIDEDLIPAKVPEKLLEENLQDISMALGVYLDNAMQAANESDNKYLIVEFKCTDKKIEFQISNTYNGNISLDKIGQEKFSTKGKNHGYGLSIVRDILSKNKHLSQEREINGIYFVQKLIFTFE